MTILLSLTTIADAQRKRRRSTGFTITSAKVRTDLVNKTVANIPARNGTRVANWTFAPNERREIAILGKSNDGNQATVTIHINTVDAQSQMMGKLKLYYEREGKTWNLTYVENIDAAVTYPRTANISPPIDTSPPVSVSPASPQSKVTTLVANEFAVPPNYYYTVRFTIPSGVLGHIYGRFRAVRGDNIRVYVLDSDGYENFQHGSNFSPYFSSGKVTVGPTKKDPLRSPLRNGSLFGGHSLTS
ncbi:MAG: hypothetical protein DMF68_10990 [Acidobacteria bacterium]|nr:MAG: hypothetical protein DMF68_10990 [Acidobacteriota bacterium]